jgi:hypothetical protein
MASADKKDVARAKAAAATKAKIAKYNSPSAQTQRGKESLTRNPKALRTKTAAQMTPKQKAANMAKEQAKAAKARKAFNKMKAQGPKINTSPTSGYGRAGKK